MTRGMAHWMPRGEMDAGLLVRIFLGHGLLVPSWSLVASSGCLCVGLAGEGGLDGQDGQGYGYAVSRPLLVVGRWCAGWVCSCGWASSGGVTRASRACAGTLLVLGPSLGFPAPWGLCSRGVRGLLSWACLRVSCLLGEFGGFSSLVEFAS